MSSNSLLLVAVHHLSMVRRVLEAEGHSREDAEDLAHEALLVLMRRVDGEGRMPERWQLRRWLIVTARRHGANETRKRRRRKTGPLEAEPLCERPTAENLVWCRQLLARVGDEGLAVAEAVQEQSKAAAAEELGITVYFLEKSLARARDAIAFVLAILGLRHAKAASTGLAKAALAPVALIAVALPVVALPPASNEPTASRPLSAEAGMLEHRRQAPSASGGSDVENELHPAPAAQAPTARVLEGSARPSGGQGAAAGSRSMPSRVVTTHETVASQPENVSRPAVAAFPEEQPGQTAVPEGPDLAAEVRSLRLARELLERGLSNEALGELDRADREFVSGPLGAERRALRSVAHCQSGRREQAAAIATELVHASQELAVPPECRP